MRMQNGFTLIELVIVIIVLGILAVTAAPKFLNVQDDARTSTLKGLEASLNSASALVYAKAILKGADDQPSATLDLGKGKSVTVKYGYPEAASSALSEVVEMNSADWSFSPVIGSNPGSIQIFPKGVSIQSGNCFVSYTEATSSALPSVVTEPCN